MTKSVNGYGVDLVDKRVGLGPLTGLMVVETDGNSRKPEKKRRKNAKPNMNTMVMELIDFKSMILFLSFTERERNRINGSEACD